MAVSPGGRPADASPLGTPGGRQNWVDKTGGLPKYIREVAHALKRKHPEWSTSRCIAVAKNAMTKWAAKSKNPSVKAAAAAADAKFNANAMRARLSPNLSNERSEAVQYLVTDLSSGRTRVVEFASSDGARVTGMAPDVARIHKALVRKGFPPKLARKFAGKAAAKARKKKKTTQHSNDVDAAQLVELATLTAKRRKKLPKSAFALPGGKYPIHDKAHARNALARVAQFGTPEQKAAVRRAVARRYKGLGKKTQQHARDGQAVELAGHWRHGYVPLDMQAALSKAHGSRKGAAKYLGGGAPRVKRKRLDTFEHGPNAGSSSNPVKRINRVDAAAIMFGVGSKQHKAAIKKFGKGGGPTAQVIKPKKKG